MRGQFYSFLGLYDRDNSIFDEFSVPTQITKDDLIGYMLFEVAEIDAIYDDPETLKKAIGFWSRSRLHAWQRIADALYKNYDPFINFTRDEHRLSTMTPDGDIITTHDNAAWNETELVTSEKLTRDDNRIVTNEETFHSEGDSALYTPTDVAEKETLLRIRYDIYNIIINEFKNRFCLLVY